MSIIIKTARLGIRQFNTKDAAFVLQLVNSPGWLKFIGNRGVNSLEEAELYLLTGPINNYERLGFGLYLVELVENSRAIGMCGFIKRDFLNEIDLGFAFLPEYMGKGYAYEAAQVTLNYAREKLQIKKVLAITTTENTRSIKLLKKLNLDFEKMMRFPDETKDLSLFSISLI